MTGFKSYLFFVGIVAFCVLFLMVILIRKQKQGPAHRKAVPIKSGSLGIFFDRQYNAVIIAYAKDKFGVGKAVGQPVMLTYPFTQKKLGSVIRNIMIESGKYEPISDNDLMRILMSQGWKEFSEGRRNVSVSYHSGYGVVMNSTRRLIDGVYQFNKMGFEKVLDSDSDDQLLGKAVMTVLSRCR